jgi:5'-nucleotidase (lipoprotein e(P4) family)
MKILSVFLLFFLIGCANNKPHNNPNEYQSGALLWQKSAEAQALQIQAYHLAKFRIDEDRKKHPNQKKDHPIIIVDVDETIVSNIEYQIKLALHEESHNSQNWLEWIHERKSAAITGAIDFFNYASSKGYEIAYVTNRKKIEFEDTEAMLRELGFPIKKEFLFVKEGADKAKPFHNKQIAKNHRIALKIGDNLIDFSEIYEKKSAEDRKLLMLKEQEKFGTEYIILPNPMYGDWESTLYDFNFSLTNEEKAKKRLDHLPLD